MRKVGSRVLAGILAVAMVMGMLAPAGAQQRRAPKLQFIRDAEIEHIIRRYAEPIFEAAGVDGAAVEIALVKDPALNAFVAGGMNLFVHTGLLMQTEEPDELIGVLAHEIGHIAGGHLIRSREAVEGASAEAILGMLLGVAAGIASGNAGAGTAVVLGSQQMAQRSLLAYSRTQEASADQAALGFLDQAGISAKGLETFLDKLADQELLPEDRQTEYVRTHPMTRNRVDSVHQHVEKSRLRDAAAAPELKDMHQRMLAKLRGFIQPAVALQRHKADDPSIPARYARAIAFYQQGKIAESLSLIDALIVAEPKNPFFHELKGQVLLENGRVPESIAPYRKSVEYLPNSALLRSALAHALIESQDPKALDEAIRHLEEALRMERRSPFSWRLMATAYGRKGNQGMTAYALAEEALTRGDLATARGQADKAQTLMPRGSPGWLRAEDIRLTAVKKRQ